jgi:hypothetical protein
VITPHFDPYDDEHINEIYYQGKVKFACEEKLAERNG